MNAIAILNATVTMIFLDQVSSGSNIFILSLVIDALSIVTYVRDIGRFFST